jgi:uncharacterized membrane protein
MSVPITERYYSRLDPRRAAGRITLAVAVGVAGAFLLLPGEHDWAVRAVAGWDVGAMTHLLFIWWLIWTSDPRETQCRAAAADPGRTVVWLLVIAASFFSLFAGIFVLRHARECELEKGALLVGLCISAIITSWALTHTAYTLRYAHLYYRDDDEGEGGLTFPGDRKPDDLDFAYFAFTVGMCFQVSDVVITSPQIRRAVLTQALLSFTYNTVIVALVLNLLFGILN